MILRRTLPYALGKKSNAWSAISMSETLEQKAVIHLVEDDPDISRLLRINLSHLNYEVKLAEDGLTGLNMILEEKPDLVILDLMLPELDGLSICQKLREKQLDVPILMLTARSEEADKILGLELGADDYLTKPFSVGELHARVRALLRRHQMASTRASSSDRQNQKSLVRFANLEIDKDKRVLRIDDRLVELTFKEFELLLYLVNHPGRAFTRSALLSEVWDYEFEGYEHTVTSHINRLRSKIEHDPSAPRYILTVRGAGYRFATEQEVS